MATNEELLEYLKEIKNESKEFRAEVRTSTKDLQNKMEEHYGEIKEVSERSKNNTSSIARLWAAAIAALGIGSSGHF